MKKTILVSVLGIILTSQVTLAAPEIFKMYKKPHASVNQGCDIYTKLVLDVDGNVGTAELSEQVDGSCEIFVPEKKRSYSLVLTNTDCGTRIFSHASEAGNSVEIEDNRGRLCENMVPAIIVLKEIDQSGNGTAIYSKDN